MRIYSHPSETEVNFHLNIFIVKLIDINETSIPLYNSEMCHPIETS